jgi:hypothetical protein
VEIVAALTRIEAEQLPVNTHEPGQENRKTLGLIYGEAKEAATPSGTIPYEKERNQAINGFGAWQYGAALLSLKRTMTKFRRYISGKLMSSNCSRFIINWSVMAFC